MVWHNFLWLRTVGVEDDEGNLAVAQNAELESFLDQANAALLEGHLHVAPGRRG